MCPVDVTVRGVSNATQVTQYAAPTVTEGAAPVTTTCAPASGSAFPLGTTSVRCTASDAQARQTSCSFNVTLTGYSMSVTKFETVGDSLTEGENGRPPQFLDIPNAYPTKLQQALDQTYPGQGLTVINRGHSGDRVEKTVAELPGILAADRPDAVLILTGFNNLFNGCGNGPVDTADCRKAIEEVEYGVRDAIRKTKEAPGGIKYIYVSTMTPPGPVAPGVRPDRRISADAIVQANARIKHVTAVEGATLVDPYPLFLGHEAEFVDNDGLHLRPAGNQVLADTFFAAIKATIPQTPLANGR
jgi:lysophospholipase L1-like esterase